MKSIPDIRLSYTIPVKRVRLKLFLGNCLLLLGYIDPLRNELCKIRSNHKKVLIQLLYGIWWQNLTFKLIFMYHRNYSQCLKQPNEVNITDMSKAYYGRAAEGQLQISLIWDGGKPMYCKIQQPNGISESCLYNSTPQVCDVCSLQLEIFSI